MISLTIEGAKYCVGIYESKQILRLAEINTFRAVTGKAEENEMIVRAEPMIIVRETHGNGRPGKPQKRYTQSWISPSTEIP